MLRKLLLLSLIVTSVVACKDDKEDAPEEVKFDIEPKFEIDEPKHFNVSITTERELRRETFESSPKQSRSASLKLTIRPEGDEYHFLWSNPEVEAMPVGTKEEQENYKIGYFNSLWSPSFAVDKDGKFLRVLEKDMIREGFRLATERSIANSPQPEVARQIANSRDPVDVMTTIGVRRWNELGGAFLPYKFAFGKPIDVELGKLEAVEEGPCPLGKCWKFTAETAVSTDELQELEEQLKAMDAQILNAKRDLQVENEVNTMLPARMSTSLELEMELANNDGEPEKGGTTIRETVDFVPQDEPAKRAVLPELADEPDSGQTDAGAKAE